MTMHTHLAVLFVMLLPVMALGLYWAQKESGRW
jgi:hypothetical protein